MSRTERISYSRRQLVHMFFGASAVASLPLGCDTFEQLVSGPLPPTGELLSPNREAGHRLRLPSSDRLVTEKANGPSKPGSHHACVIVGAGVAGLSAGWHLQQHGVDDFLILELESEIGGTSRSGRTSIIGKNGDFRYPWGAHYLPVPKADNEPLVKFLQECGVVDSVSNGRVHASEDCLCREPEERVFAQGRWWSGLIPDGIASAEDRSQLKRFNKTILRWSTRIGTDGKPLFAIPTSRCSHDRDAVELDQISMSQWMASEKFDSKLLVWLVNYACRDDYGLMADQTSAWAGLFYFAARIIDSAGATQPVMTWPEGNGFLVDQLRKRVGDRIRTNHAVMEVSRQDSGPLLLKTFDTLSGSESTLSADQVIMAVPQFIANRVLIDAERTAVHSSSREAFQYGAWWVANVHLTERPKVNGFPMAWDNVPMSSTSLGYVNSVHQTGRDHGPTVLTWYTAISDQTSQVVREKMLRLTWAEVAELVITDLEMTHPDIRPLISRLDVMLWGHAMVQPRVGTIFHSGRTAAAKSFGNVHFACTDLSGIALFEEAFDHGRRAAESASELIAASERGVTSFGPPSA